MELLTSEIIWGDFVQYNLALIPQFVAVSTKKHGVVKGDKDVAVSFAQGHLIGHSSLLDIVCIAW